ncbi:hypothetical protein HWV62_14252 [Athelia sp. TMB]|nr:hypothetical protein HWV62_14252 [Athelia sp. TMB]
MATSICTMGAAHKPMPSKSTRQAASIMSSTAGTPLFTSSPAPNPPRFPTQATMRFSIALIALSAIASASASVFPRQTLPSCAVPCLQNANFGSCAEDDNVCLCNDQTFITSTTQCIEGACSGSDLTNAEQYSAALCKAVGVTLTSTPSPSATAPAPSSTATSPTTTSAPSGGSSSSASSASAAASSTSTGAALSTRANAALGALAFLGAAFAL